MKFSEKLIKLRKENKLSQEQLANMLDVSRQSVSKWESGQTYPEMDKLLTLCKIFKCSLDDLTNDEITQDNMSNNLKKKNTFMNFLYEMLEFINKSVSMLKQMSFKQLGKCFFELLIILIILLLMRIPFDFIVDLGDNIIDNFYGIGGIISDIWHFIIYVIYLIFFIIIFTYIFKTRYVDNYHDKDLSSSEDLPSSEALPADKKIEKYECVTEKKPRMRKNFALFNILGSLLTYMLKFIVLCMTFPFICLLLILPILLIIDIILMCNKIIFIGIFLGLIFAILFNVIMVEIAFNFIFNMTINFKKAIVVFIISIIGMGISIGTFMMEISNIEYLDEMPPNNELIKEVKEFSITGNTFITSELGYISCEENCPYPYPNIFEINHGIEYVIDDNLKNKIKMEITYNEKYTKVYLTNEKTGAININTSYEGNYNFFNYIKNTIIKDLKNHRLYNYDLLQKVSIKIYISQQNIDLLKKNGDKYYQQIREEQYNNMFEDHYAEIDRLNERITSLEDEIDKLEQEKETLIEEKDAMQEEIETYKSTIEEYKNRLSELLNME